MCVDFLTMVIEDVKAGDQLDEFIETLKKQDSEKDRGTRDFLTEYVNENAPLWAENSD